MAAGTQVIVPATSTVFGNKKREVWTLSANSGDTITSDMARPETISGPLITAYSIAANVITLTLSGSATTQRYEIIGT